MDRRFTILAAAAALAAMSYAQSAKAVSLGYSRGMGWGLEQIDAPVNYQRVGLPASAAPIWWTADADFSL
jgi:hypothetical protein